jgi:hypothetical protein
MDRSEIGNLFDLIGLMLEKSTPMEAEYWRGYYEGIKFYYRGGMITVRDHYHLRKIADMAHADPYHKAYVRGYRDGCDGKKPKDTPLARDIPPEFGKAAG